MLAFHYHLPASLDGWDSLGETADSGATAGAGAVGWALFFSPVLLAAGGAAIACRGRCAGPAAVGAGLGALIPLAILLAVARP